MSNSNSKTDELGDEVMKNIGALNSSTSQLKTNEKKSCDVDPAEVGNWITAIGKAILSIFRTK